jgi:hypothetical protein
MANRKKWLARPKKDQACVWLTSGAWHAWKQSHRKDLVKLRLRDESVIRLVMRLTEG